LSLDSQAATLPITIQTVVETGLVSESIANIVLPIGANVNMDGSAVGFPCAINFLAHSNRYHMNAVSWLNVAIGSTLGSIGAAPVPSAGLVILITVWETVFPGKEIPQAVAYVQVHSQLNSAIFVSLKTFPVGH
jgi:Na+/H+-dicarboxylate symporter